MWQDGSAVDFQGDHPSQHLSDEEYEHDDSADSLRVKLPECLILRHLLQEAYRIIAKELPHGGGVGSNNLRILCFNELMVKVLNHIPKKRSYMI